MDGTNHKALSAFTPFFYSVFVLVRVPHITLKRSTSPIDVFGNAASAVDTFVTKFTCL